MTTEIIPPSTPSPDSALLRTATTLDPPPPPPCGQRGPGQAVAGPARRESGQLRREVGGACPDDDSTVLEGRAGGGQRPAHVGGVQPGVRRDVRGQPARLGSQT